MTADAADDAYTSRPLYRAMLPRSGILSLKHPTTPNARLTFEPARPARGRRKRPGLVCPCTREPRG